MNNNSIDPRSQLALNSLAASMHKAMQSLNYFNLFTLSFMQASYSNLTERESSAKPSLLTELLHSTPEEQLANFQSTQRCYNFLSIASCMSSFSSKFY